MSGIIRPADFSQLPAVSRADGVKFSNQAAFSLFIMAYASKNFGEMTIPDAEL